MKIIIWCARKEGRVSLSGLRANSRVLTSLLKRIKSLKRSESFLGTISRFFSLYCFFFFLSLWHFLLAFIWIIHSFPAMWPGERYRFNDEQMTESVRNERVTRKCKICQLLWCKKLAFLTLPLSNGFSRRNGKFSLKSSHSVKINNNFFSQARFLASTKSWQYQKSEKRGTGETRTETKRMKRLVCFLPPLL